MMKQTKINWKNKIKHPIKGRLPVVKARVNGTKKTETPRTFEKEEITRRK